MTTMRRRREFAAEVQTESGRPETECYVYMEIETSVNGRVREHRWSGKLSSLTEPKSVLDGIRRLRPLDSEKVFTIQVVEGATQRLGITSDEYVFLGRGDPPEIANKERKR
jgi:hypothetical protein